MNELKNQNRMKSMNENRTKKAISLETFGALLFIGLFFGYLGSTMGVGNMFNTLMNTGHDLLLNTGFFIMAIAVLAGAFSSVMTEFGVVALINKIISPIMRPLYHLPGAASLAIINTFLSDNPAVISLTEDKAFKDYFTKYEFPVLCNLGTSFGMGLIVWTYMSSLGDGTTFIVPATIGVIGAFIGSVVSVRIMGYYTKKHYGVDKETIEAKAASSSSFPVRLKVPAIGKIFATLLLTVICASGDEPNNLKLP